MAFDNHPTTRSLAMGVILMGIKIYGVLAELLRQGWEFVFFNFKSASEKHKKGYVYRNRATSREQDIL